MDYELKNNDKHNIITDVIYLCLLVFLLKYLTEKMSQPHRAAVLNLYKTLLFLGREWPQGYDLFRKRLHKVFTKNSFETDNAKIETMLKHGEFVVKEIEALYSLKKYRTMKRRYYNDD